MNEGGPETGDRVKGVVGWGCAHARGHARAFTRTTQGDPNPNRFKFGTASASTLAPMPPRISLYPIPSRLRLQATIKAQAIR